MVVHRAGRVSLVLVYGRRMDGDLEERITARLVQVVEHQRRGGFEVLDGQLALVDEDGTPRLSLADVARLAAAEAHLGQAPNHSGRAK